MRARIMHAHSLRPHHSPEVPRRSMKTDSAPEVLGTLLEDTTRMQSRRTVRDYMSPCVHSIGKGQMVATAHAMMRKWQIRHLPVLDAGRVVGVLSLRDLHLVETLSDVDPTKVPVEDAMSPEPYTVAPNAELRTVAVEMATRKLGSALVVNRDKVIGIF